MHPVCLISKALDTADADYPVLPDSYESGVCAITGLESNTYPRKDLLGKSFTDGAVLAAPTSDRVSQEAWIALKYKWERMSSWICDGETFARLDRIGVRNAVFGDMPHRPWAGYATTSYKKHGALRAPVNGGGKNIWLFESRIADCSDKDKLTDWWKRINDALLLGFGRAILETLDCPQHVMRKIGLAEWMAFEAWARPIHRSALYAFLCYLLPSQEELKHVRNEIKPVEPERRPVSSNEQDGLFAGLD